MKEYQVLEYDVNSPVDKAVSVPLDSVYGLAVKVIKDGAPVALSGDELSVGNQTGEGEADGYSLFSLSSGSEPGTKQLDVEVNKSSGETYEYENTIPARQPLANRETVITIALSTFLEGTEIAPSNIAEFEMSSSLTPNAGGDPITETYELSNAEFYGHVSGGLNGWWRIGDGKWKDQIGSQFADTIILDKIGTRNTQIKSQIKYPQSAGTATFKLVFKFGDGEDLSTKFKLIVKEKDMGYIDTFN